MTYEVSRVPSRRDSSGLASKPTSLHGRVWYGMELYGAVWYGMVWYGMDLPEVVQTRHLLLLLDLLEDVVAGRADPRPLVIHVAGHVLEGLGDSALLTRAHKL